MVCTTKLIITIIDMWQVKFLRQIFILNYVLLRAYYYIVSCKIEVASLVSYVHTFYFWNLILNGLKIAPLTAEIWSCYNEWPELDELQVLLSYTYIL